MGHLAAFLKRAGAEFIQGSVTDLPLLQKHCRGTQYVFHLAAVPSVAQSINSPLNSHEANLTGVLNTLLAARDNQVKKFIFASSAAVYGDNPVLPLKENMVPNPLSPYAVAKLAGEYYGNVFHQVYGLPTVGLRYFNVYGLRQDPQSAYAAAIPKFILQISEGKVPVIYGDGEQSRDFVFVKDVVEANILAAESDASGVFNIASGDGISINKLVEIITSAAKSPIRPIHGEARPGEIRHSRADISKVRSMGYYPRHHLKAELINLIRNN
jgi:UDP-glucose 4-epimerase